MSERKVSAPEEPITEMLPEWVRKERHQILSAVNCAIVFPEQFDGTRDELAITPNGLTLLPEAFKSYNAFNDYLLEINSRYSVLQGSEFLRVPRKYPQTVIKIDSYNKGVATLLTLEALARRLSRTTRDYRFKPISLFWSLPDMICMEKLDEKETRFGESAYESIVRGKIKLTESAESGGLDLSIDPNDRVYLGMDSRDKPIISLVDVCDSNIIEKLNN